ncbi:MAG: PDZ domain-containing protein [Ferruginibacter sp.]
MKKVLLTAAVIGFSALSFTASAQEDKEVIIEKSKKDKAVAEKDRKETQEIIIRKKGDKDTKITVEIKGDKITVNGKPLNEFKDGDITINKREFKFFDGQRNFAFGPGEEMEMLLNGDHLGSFGMDEGKPRAFLGVTTNSNVEDGKESKAGAEITNVSKGSAAEKAGLKEGDIITKVDNAKVENPADLTEAITSHKPKDEVTVYYKRDGKDMSAKATLGETKQSRSMSYSFSGPGGQMRSFTMPRNNMQPRIQTVPGFEWNEDMNGNFEPFKELTVTGFPRQQKLGLRIQDTEDGAGVKVLDADKDSPAEKAGLQKDDIVTEIGGVKVNNTDDAREQLRENAGKSNYTIKAKRNGKEISFDIRIPKKLKTADL